MLIVLGERPVHGYELITELEARSAGRWRPSAGSIYPALGRMEKQGLISSDEVDGKKVFSLTASGREALDSIDVDDADPTPQLWRDAGHGHGALRSVPPEIVGQARQIRRFGSADQIERAAAVLEETKRQLYAILAAGPEHDDTNDTGP
ncbi:MAG: PadR family transcriptional regulator [Acidimicrobiales bacterium]